MWSKGHKSSPREALTLQSQVHQFFNLDETDRTHWIAALFDAPGTPPPYGIRYPIIRSGETPYTWLCDQFRKAQEITGLQDRIRSSVVEILVTEAAREPVRERAQVLGQLLEVAGTCGFVTPIDDLLSGWIRADAYARDRYHLGSHTIPVRQTVWSILIAWRKTEKLKRYLLRDFSRPDLGSQNICFAEMGRLAPEEGIRHIPDILDWPEPYWREALYSFLSSLGARAALAADLREAWTDCFGDILFNQYKTAMLIGDMAPLRGVLLEVGILFDPSSGNLDFSPQEDRLHNDEFLEHEEILDDSSVWPATASRKVLSPIPALPFVGALSVVGIPRERVEISRDLINNQWDHNIVNFINQTLIMGAAANSLGS
jgi:hypothetical protein